MMHRLILPYLFLSIFLSACEEIVDFPDSGTERPEIVIEAVLTDQYENQTVRVSYSTAINDSTLGVPENNAIVRIISGEGDTFSFPDGHEGIYQMLFKAEEDETYRLEVTVNGTVYTSEGRTIPINGIDSLYCRQMINPENGDSAWYVYMDAGRSYPMDTRYYMLDMTKNEELITYGSEIWIFRDSYTDSINGIKFPIAFQKGDTVIIGLSSLSNSMFDYYFKLSYEVFTINLSNISYRCNLPMMFDPKAMGYFQVSCTDRKEIIIKQADQ